MDIENLQLIDHMARIGKKTYRVEVSHLALTDSFETLCGISFAFSEDLWIFQNIDPEDYEYYSQSDLVPSLAKLVTKHQKYILENVGCDECFKELVDIVEKRAKAERKKAKYSFPREI